MGVLFCLLLYFCLYPEGHFGLVPVTFLVNGPLTHVIVFFGAALVGVGVGFTVPFGVGEAVAFVADSAALSVSVKITGALSFVADADPVILIGAGFGFGFGFGTVTL